MVPFLVIQLRRTRSWSRVAHAGALLLIVGAGVSTFDRHDTISVAPGATQMAAGVEVTNDGLDIRTGNRLGTDEVVANLRVDGRTMTPRLVVYRDRRGRLAGIAVHTGWTTDTHAVLEDAFDNGAAVVTIHRRHGMWLVWVGTADRPRHDRRPPPPEHPARVEGTPSTSRGLKVRTARASTSHDPSARDLGSGTVLTAALAGEQAADGVGGRAAGDRHGSRRRRAGRCRLGP